MKKISVIIPVYNGEKFISRSVESVLNQVGFDNDDIEILLLNDGSKDDSLDVLKQLENSHAGIVKVYDQHNMGVAKTRNRGIQLATGQYIIFIDQDDWIDQDYLKTFYDVIHEGNFDVVSGGYRRPDTEGNIRQKSLAGTQEYSKYIIVAAWAKIHRTNFLKNNNISFFDNRFGEDAVFTVKEILSTDKWAQINYVGYNWFYNILSVSNTSQQGLKEEDRSSLISLLDKLIGLSDSSSKNYNLFKYYILRTVIGYLIFSGRNASQANFLKAYNDMFAHIEDKIPNLYKNNYLFFGPSGEVFRVRIAIALVVLLRKLRLMRLFAKIYCS